MIRDQNERPSLMGIQSCGKLNTYLGCQKKCEKVCLESYSENHIACAPK